MPFTDSTPTDRGAARHPLNTRAAVLQAWEMLDVGLGASWWKIWEVLAMESVQRDLFLCFGKLLWKDTKNEDLWINFWDAVGVKM